MLVVLDTNHFRELVQEGALGQKLLARIDEKRADVFISVVVAEESIRGWFALLNREKPGHDQLLAYAELKRCFDSLAHFDLLEFDHDAADVFARLRKEFPRLGTMDLKIAAICMAHDGLLLSRNLGDFNQIPGLRVENWLD